MKNVNNPRLVVERVKPLFTAVEICSLGTLPQSLCKLDKASGRSIMASSYVDNVVVLEVCGPDVPSWAITIECDARDADHVACALMTGRFE